MIDEPQKPSYEELEAAYNKALTEINRLEKKVRDLKRDALDLEHIIKSLEGK